MPKYILPEKKESTEKEEAVCAPGLDYARVLYVPGNKEILDSLKLNASASVVLKGKIVGLEAREGADYSSHEFKLELDSVETSAENEFSELVDDD